MSLLFPLVCGSLAWSQDPSIEWLRFFQYQPHAGGWKSEIPNQEFFLSPEGRTNPQAELSASLEIFTNHNEKNYGLHHLEPLCAFPARALLLEKLLKIKFHWPDCPDVKNWTENLDVDHLSVVFAGAYTNNPASLFGHTFLRLYSRRAKTNELLTNAVGFLAAVEDGATGPSYMLKGLTGQYMGYYNIQPYYMSTAFYNNSEGRDLWEYPLKLSAETVRWLTLYLWELTFNSGMPYYFIDENCAYRLLSFVEAADARIELTQNLGWVVLPIDTVRVLDSAGLVDRPHVTFRPSILRKLKARLKSMTLPQKNLYHKAKNSLKDLEQIKDPEVLDALIDHWTYRNYKASAHLSDANQHLYDTTLNLRAQIPLAPKVPEITAETPDLGHHTSWWDLGAGSADEKTVAKVAFRLGAHELTMNPFGYDQFAAIEYLGFDLNSDLKNSRLVLGKAISLNPFTFDFPNYSWLFEATLERDSILETNKTGGLNISGGLGLSFEPFESPVNIFIIPQLHSLTSADGGNTEPLAGTRLGIRFHAENLLFLAQTLWEQSLQDSHQKFGENLRLAYVLSRDDEIFIDGTYDTYYDNSIVRTASLNFRRAF